MFDLVAGFCHSQILQALVALQIPSRLLTAPRDLAALSRETRVPLSIGGLHVEVVADRVDELDGGALVILDYKTGRARVADEIARVMATLSQARTG